MHDIEDIKRMNDEAVAQAQAKRAIDAAMEEAAKLESIVTTLRHGKGDGVAVAFLKGYELALQAWQAQRPTEELRAFAAGFLISGVARHTRHPEEVALFERASASLIAGIEAADDHIARRAAEEKQAA